MEYNTQQPIWEIANDAQVIKICAILLDVSFQYEGDHQKATFYIPYP